MRTGFFYNAKLEPYFLTLLIIFMPVLFSTSTPLRSETVQVNSPSCSYWSSRRFMSPLVSVCKPDAFVSLPTGEVGKAEFEYRDASEPLILLCKIEYPDGDIGDWLSEDLCVVDQDAFYKAVAKLRDSSAIEYGDHPSSCEAGMFVVWSKGKTVGFGTVLESADKHSCRITLTDGTVETQEMGDMFFAPEGQSMSTCQAGARVTTSHGNGGVVAADSKKVCMVKMDDGKTGAFMVGQLITNSAP